MSKLTQNNESSNPSSPSNGSWNIFPKSDGYYLQNHTGAVNILNVYGATIAVQDEGVPLGTPGTLNFVGDNVSVTVSGTVARVFITGTASAGGVSDGDKGDITVSGGGTTWNIDPDAVTLDKLTNATAQYRLLGRISSGAGDFQEITGSADVFNILGAASYAAIRTLLSLVTGTNIQPYATNLDEWATINPSTNGASLVSAADYAAMRSLLSLVTGTNVQAQDVELQSLADLISGVDRLPYFSATGVFSLTAFPAFGRTLLSGTTAGEMRTTLGLYPQAVVTITDATTGTIDASQGRTFELVATGNRIIGIPANPTNGQPIIITHKASGGDRTLTLHTGSAGGFFVPSSITMSATPSGTTDYIGAQYNSTKNRWDVLAYMKGYW